ncbi:uncharacterized protein LOC109124226 [Vitis vinifera]|uniref:uncharacterized protein LOC109124226 n=1 Tax=Vitis vinifera TaxID=29760 RepID=UPI0008FEBCFB|nr:uncharacterized protein LOC109124226 [Vitis vinifera]|eukprot:XP_019081608.1 PREDICTED: uncharacterized protein LOC109124226 [Vitis vinifera]
MEGTGWTGWTGTTNVGKESHEYFCCRFCETGIAWKHHVKTPITLTLQEQTKMGLINHVGSFFITDIISQLRLREPELEPNRMIVHDHGQFQAAKITYIYCSNCFSQLGWKVVAVEEGSDYHPFQEGQFVLPLENILLWNGYNFQVPQAPAFMLH